LWASFDSSQTFSAELSGQTWTGVATNEFDRLASTPPEADFPVDEANPIKLIAVLLLSRRKIICDAPLGISGALQNWLLALATSHSWPLLMPHSTKSLTGSHFIGPPMPGHPYVLNGRPVQVH
jgi:hypothetical protein